MGIFGDHTLQDLRNATVDQIRNKIKQKIDLMTKKQLIILILKATDTDIENWEEVKRVISTGDKRGQLLEVDEVRDILGNKVKSIKKEWEYYPKEIFSDERVRLIRIRHFDKNGIELVGQGQEIEHLPNGEVRPRSI